MRMSVSRDLLNDVGRVNLCEMYPESHIVLKSTDSRHLSTTASKFVHLKTPFGMAINTSMRCPDHGKGLDTGELHHVIYIMRPEDKEKSIGLVIRADERRCL